MLEVFKYIFDYVINIRRSLFTIVKVEQILAAFPSGWKKRAKSLFITFRKLLFLASLKLREKMDFLKSYIHK